MNQTKQVSYKQPSEGHKQIPWNSFKPLQSCLWAKAVQLRHSFYLLSLPCVQLKAHMELPELIEMFVDEEKVFRVSSFPFSGNNDNRGVALILLRQI